MKEKLKKLNLAELESLYRLIDEGLYDGDKTITLKSNYGYTARSNDAFDKRRAILRDIEMEIKVKISSIIL